MLTVLRSVANGKSEKAKDGSVSEEGLIYDSGGRCHRVEAIRVFRPGVFCTPSSYSRRISFSYDLLRGFTGLSLAFLGTMPSSSNLPTPDLVLLLPRRGTSGRWWW